MVANMHLFFIIFAVFDVSVSVAVNMWLNCSFLKLILSNSTTGNVLMLIANWLFIFLIVLSPCYGE